MKEEFDPNLVSWEGDGTVSYRGRICGQFIQTGKFWNDGKDPIYMGLNAGGVAYTAQGAAIDEARVTWRRRKHK